MNTVNDANNSFKLFKPTYVDIFGQKFDTGYMENVGFPGLGRLNIMDMMQRTGAMGLGMVLFLQDAARSSAPVRFII